MIKNNSRIYFIIFERDFLKFCFEPNDNNLRLKNELGEKFVFNSAKQQKMKSVMRENSHFPTEKYSTKR